jgi:VWFA-related protein
MITTTLQLRWARLIGIAAVAIAAGGWFQSAPSTPEVPAPTIRVSTHLVLVDVVVTDKQGNPVTGLRPEDFVVEENGKPQKISAFVTPHENAAPVPPLPPGVYSNKPEYRSSGGPITVMLLDAVNTPFSDQGYARRQMLNFVQNQYKPGQKMAIFTFTGSLRLLQDFTTDPGILLAALQRYKPQAQEFAAAGRAVTSAASGDPTTLSTVAALDAGTPPLTTTGGGTVALAGASVASAGAASVQAALEAFAGAQAGYAQEQRADLTLRALNSLARTLGGLPGRKSIIWVTGNLPFSLIPENRTMTEAELEETLPSLDTRRVGQHAAGNEAATLRRSHSDDIRELNSRLASAQIAIYPIDARGLTLSTAIDTQSTMREMAHETGGRAYVNQNEIKFGVERAMQDTSAAYTIGYYPENKKYDGKYRQIRVKVKRDGVSLQNRQGYFAMDRTQNKGYDPSQEVISALGDAAPATLVAFTVQLKPPSVNTVKGKVGVTFLVDATTLSVEETSAGKRLNLAFYATVYSSDGKIVANISQKVDQAFNAETYRQILEHGMLLHMDLDLKPGNNQLRLAVQDNRTGMVGTLEAPTP